MLIVKQNWHFSIFKYFNVNNIKDRLLKKRPALYVPKKRRFYKTPVKTCRPVYGFGPCLISRAWFALQAWKDES